MKATKYMVTIELEVLHLDTVPGLVIEVVEIMRNENSSGSLIKEDGDQIKWGTKGVPVEF